MDGLERIQQRIGYSFSDRAVLIQGLTHKSFGHEFLKEKPIALRDNERLEFLGDSILDVVVSDILIETFPEAPEGQLSKMRASVVNEKTLAELARQLGIPEVLRLGKGETQTGGHMKPSILSSTFEALIAAIYLDGGFNAVYPVVRHLFAPLFSKDRMILSFNDHKTQLQETVQAQFRLTPTYHLLATNGPDHAKTFEVEVRVGSRALARAAGNSKKDAEQAAARAALEGMGP
jgi:ribonuclease III